MIKQKRFKLDTRTLYYIHKTEQELSEDNEVRREATKLK